MIVRRHFFLIAFSFLLIYGCKKVDHGTPAIKGATLTVSVTNALSLSGPVVSSSSSLDLSATGFTYGFCYSKNRNPTIPGLNTTSADYASGSFSASVSNIEYGNKYYVRSFVTNGFATTYSTNQDSFFIPLYISTDTVKNIGARSFDISIYTLPAIADSISERGVCYDTLAQPVITGMKTVSPVIDTGKILIQVNDSLKPGKTYYLRSYCIANGRPLYGKQVSFKTSGYKSTYGFVILDKGDTTNGWRYLEAAFDSSVIARTGITWGCTGTDITGTSAAVAAGQANTDAIVAGCSDTAAAAYICQELTLKSKSDWFLPSAEELKILYQLKLSSVYKITPKVFSSTQASASDCFIIDFSTGEQRQLPKASGEAVVWPMRRYK